MLLSIAWLAAKAYITVAPGNSCFRYWYVGVCYDGKGVDPH